MDDHNNQHRLSDFIQEEYHRLIAYAKHLFLGEGANHAEDLVQELMVNLFERADITSSIENLSGYVYQSIRYKVIDFFRTRKKAVSLDQPLTTDNNLTLGDILTQTQLQTTSAREKEAIADKLYNILDTLTEEERALIIATELDNQSFAYLANKSGIPVNTLLSRKSRALQKIKNRFKHRKAEVEDLL